MSLSFEKAVGRAATKVVGGVLFAGFAITVEAARWVEGEQTFRQMLRGLYGELRLAIEAHPLVSRFVRR